MPHFVKKFNINGVKTRQITCIELHGKPNAATRGAVGVLGMDVDSPDHEIYKCVAVNGSLYTWVLCFAGETQGGDVQTLEEMLQGFDSDPGSVKKYVDECVGDSVTDERVAGAVEKYLDENPVEGKPGKDGADGKDGEDGADGANGASAYEIAVERGFEGTEAEWLESLHGRDGKDGANGVDGANGKDGANGNNGADGRDGVTPHIGEDGYWYIGNTSTGIKAHGENGADGKDGINGQDGKNGTDGKDGTNGQNGADGVGIKSIVKTASSGLVDTYTITLTNNVTATFTVTNGKDGTNGTNGVDGKDGKDGDPYTLTETDKFDILQMVVEHYGGDPAAGHFDENNDFVLNDKFPDGDYTVKIMTADGYTVVGSISKHTTSKTYTITWKNYDGTILETDTVTEGETPVYSGSTPTRAEDDQYTYTFNGWNKTVVAATADATYTATYAQTAKPVEPAIVNILDTAYDTDLKTVYNGVGWKANTRVSNSSGVTTGTKCILTGLIPLGDNGDVFHIRGVERIDYVSGSDSGYYTCWDSGGNFIANSRNPTPDTCRGTDSNGDFTLTMAHSKWTIPSGTAYLRFQFGSATSAVIMTRNRLIQ